LDVDHESPPKMCTITQELYMANLASSPYYIWPMVSYELAYLAHDILGTKITRICECDHTVQRIDNLCCKILHFVASHKHLEDV